MEEISDLKKRIDHVQFGDVKALQEKVTNIELELAKNSILTESNTKAMEKMSDTMDKVSNTMIQLSSGIEQSNRVSGELSKKVDNLENKFDTLEDKSKFDILQFLKQNWIGIVVGCGVIAYLFIK